MKAFFLILTLAFSLFANDASIEELKNSLRGISKSMPIDLYLSVKWTKAYIEGNNVTYHFSFEDEDLAETHLDTKDKTSLKFCEQDRNKTLLSKGYSLTLVYFLKDLKIDEIVLNKDVCNSLLF